MQHPDRFLGIAGPAVSDQDKAVLKQAVFLLRCRARLVEAAVSSFRAD